MDSIKVTALTRAEHGALKQYLDDSERAATTLTATTVTFNMDKFDAKTLLTNARDRAIEAHGKNANPVASIESIVRKLDQVKED